MAKAKKKPAPPVDPEDNKAWRKPLNWKPKKACEECGCEGFGPNKTYHGDELVDWDDCPRCDGTGEEPEPE